MSALSKKLINLLSNEKSVFIQTHDFPDPDAIASAFGLQYFLKQKGIGSRILYEGELQTNPVESMISDLGISMERIDETDVREEEKIIIIDGCIGNNNVTNLKGEVVAVIDHHQGEKPDNVPFVDIRTNYGSCSTIVSSYIEEQKIGLTPPVATALAIGIHVDTDSFRRRPNYKDVEIFSFLYEKIDQDLLSSILRKKINLEEFETYKKIFSSIVIDHKFAFFYYPGLCSRNLLGMLADFFLSIEEVKFVTLCARSEGKVIFSIRNENPEWNAGLIVQKALKDIGYGGGHKDMAGGVLKNLSLFNEEQVYQRFRAQLGI